ncbi:hypothetical protein DSM3645_03033 [Blastopirellula marina DSM 3645]|uniref:Uncharacterized protein n=1 Tax=Blastopirellula marina DSM 3645 TaxID=314230 RepID=A3ZVS0_9BACT|nr:hypothetical protein DSM3645_03033 [Blastopirellula marina DSM 3645]
MCRLWKPSKTLDNFQSNYVIYGDRNKLFKYSDTAVFGLIQHGNCFNDTFLLIKPLREPAVGSVCHDEYLLRNFQK